MTGQLREPTPRITTTAVVILHGTKRLELSTYTLRALAQQSVKPDRIEVIAPRQLPAEIESQLETAKDSGQINRLIRVSKQTSLNAMVSAAQNNCSTDALWLLFNDSLPGPDTLRRQLSTMRNLPGTVVVGCTRRKLPDEMAEFPEGFTADDATGLKDVGLSCTWGGRLVTGVSKHEIDQGQFADRGDILAVPLDGMLLNVSEVRTAGGFDPQLSSPWLEVDMCRRIWRHGNRVVVAPEACVLAHAEDTAQAETVKAQAQDRASQIITRIKRKSFPLAVLDVLFLPLLTVLRMLVAVAAHQGKQLGVEILGMLLALKLAPGAIRRSFANARSAKISRRALRRLYLPRSESRKAFNESVRSSLFASDDRSIAHRIQKVGVAKRIDERSLQRINVAPVWALVTLLVSGVSALFMGRNLLGSGYLHGGNLINADVPIARTLASINSNWVPGGLGHSATVDPFTRLFGMLLIPGIDIALALMLSWILAIMGMFYVLGAVTRSGIARAALALSFGFLPPLLTAFIAGQWQTLLGIAGLVWASALITHAVGLPGRTEEASISAAAGAGLLLVLPVAVAPSLLLPVAITAIALAMFVKGRRGRIIGMLIPSIALLVPSFAGFWQQPRMFFANAINGGLAVQPSGKQLLMLWPSTVDIAGLSKLNLYGVQLNQILGYSPVLFPILLFALLALLSGKLANFVARFAWVTAALFFGYAYLLTQIVIGFAGRDNADGVLLYGDATMALAVVGALLIVAAAAGIDALRRYPDSPRDGWLIWARPIAFAVTTIILAGSLISWSFVAPDLMAVSKSPQRELPAAVLDAANSPSAQRALIIEVEDAQTWRVKLRQGERDLTSISNEVRARQVQGGWQVVALNSADKADQAFALAVGKFLGSGREVPEAEFQNLNISYVVLTQNLDQATELTASLDTNEALTSVARNERFGLWRLRADTAYATVQPVEETASFYAQDQLQTLSTNRGRIGAYGEIKPMDQPRVVRISARADQGWQAWIDNTQLKPVTIDGWAQGFEIPTKLAGNLTINHNEPSAGLFNFGIYVVWLLTLLLALPLRRPIREVKGAAR